MIRTHRIMFIPPYPLVADSSRTYGETSKGSQQGIHNFFRALLFRSYELNVDLLRTKLFSDKMKTHVDMLAPSRTKRVLSLRYGSLVILENPDT